MSSEDTNLTADAALRVEESVLAFRKRLVKLAMHYSSGCEAANSEHVDEAHFYLLDEILPGSKYEPGEFPRLPPSEQDHFAQRIVHGVGIAICVLITVIIAMRLRS